MVQKREKITMAHFVHNQPVTFVTQPKVLYTSTPPPGLPELRRSVTSAVTGPIRLMPAIPQLRSYSPIPYNTTIPSSRISRSQVKFINPSELKQTVHVAGLIAPTASTPSSVEVKSSAPFVSYSPHSFVTLGNSQQIITSSNNYAGIIPRRSVVMSSQSPMFSNSQVVMSSSNEGVKSTPVELLVSSAPYISHGSSHLIQPTFATITNTTLPTTSVVSHLPSSTPGSSGKVVFETSSGKIQKTFAHFGDPSKFSVPQTFVQAPTTIVIQPPEKTVSSLPTYQVTTGTTVLAETPNAFRRSVVFIDSPKTLPAIPKTLSESVVSQSSTSAFITSTPLQTYTSISPLTQGVTYTTLTPAFSQSAVKVLESPLSSIPVYQQTIERNVSNTTNTDSIQSYNSEAPKSLRPSAFQNHSWTPATQISQTLNPIPVIKHVEVAKESTPSGFAVPTMIRRSIVSYENGTFKEM